MAKCRGNDIGSLLLNRATSTTTTATSAAAAATDSASFNIWKSFSATSLRRKLLSTISCGGSSLSRRHRRESSGCKAPKENTSGAQEECKQQPQPRARSEKLCDLLNLAEIHEKGENEAEARKKVDELEKLKRLAEDLQFGDGGKRKNAARDVRSVTKENAEARATLAMLGAIPPLVGMLDCSDHDSQIAALYALLNLGIGNDM